MSIDSTGLSNEAVLDLFLSTFDYVFGRLTARLEGLTDHEYLWEPVSGCMTVRSAPEGFMPDSGRGPDENSPPFTTIAWRLSHISGPVLKGEAEWLRRGEYVEYRQGPSPETADGAIEELRASYSILHSVLETFPIDRLGTPIGPSFGPYAEDSNAALIMHVLDELIHHGAEIGAVRDLYAHREDA